MTEGMPVSLTHSATGATFTHLLDGRVIVMQPVKGYRIGMDGALLAAACAGLLAESRPRNKQICQALELGCGVGGALLSLKARCPDLSLTGIEREPHYIELGQENIRLNAVKDVRILAGDIGAGFRSTLSSLDLEAASIGTLTGARPRALPRFDLVFSNPPYFDDPDALRAPHDAKRAAWIAEDGLGVWLDFAVASVKDGGEIVFIHRADRLADILSGLMNKCGSFVIRPVQPFNDKGAKRVLVRAQRLGRSPLRLLSPLILHDEGDRKHTPEVEAILRGETALSW